MKFLKIISVALYAMLFVSCGEQPTQPNYNKYAIQLDTNWVEVFDIDTLNLCFGSSYWGFKNMVNHQLILKSEEEYKKIFDEAVKISGKDFKWQKCDTNYKPTGIDFSNKIIIEYAQTSTPSIWTRRIFYNSKEDEYLYLLSIQIKVNKNGVVYEVADGYHESISLTKNSNNTKVNFDTIKSLIYE